MPKVRYKPKSENEVAIEDLPHFNDHQDWLEQNQPKLVEYHLKKAGSLLHYLREATRKAMNREAELIVEQKMETRDARERVYAELVNPIPEKTRDRLSAQGKKNLRAFRDRMSSVPRTYL